MPTPARASATSDDSARSSEENYAPASGAGSLALAPGMQNSTGSASPVAGTSAAAGAGLTLHDAIERARTGPLAQIADERVNESRGLVRQAGLGPNPRLYTSSEDIRPWASEFDFANNTEDYVYLAQTFETAGKRRRRVELAKANLHRSEDLRELEFRSIAGRVAAAYWTAVSSVQIELLLEEDLHAMEELVRYHQQRVDAGAMKGVDLLRIQIERDRVALALEGARREVALSRVDLFRQIGIPFNESLQLTDALTPSAPVILVEAQVALAQRIDLKIARDQVDAAQADVKLQRSLGVPDPDVFGGYKRNSGADTLYASLQIPLPVRNRNQGEIERAAAALRLAQAQYQRTELIARAEISAARTAYETQQRIVGTILPDMRARARQNLNIMNEAYRIGGVDLLRYLDAERTEIDVEVSAIRTLSDYQQSVLRLQLAYGIEP